MSGKWAKGSQEAAPSKLGGDCEMTIRREIKGRREAAAAGRAGNGGRDEGERGSRDEKGVADPAWPPLPHPLLWKSHQWLSERGGV